MPVFEIGIGEHVGNLDRAPFARGLAAWAEPDAHTHVAKPWPVLLGPVEGRNEPHEFRRAIDEIHRRETRAHHGAHAIERKLKDILGTVGTQERMHDLPHRDELAMRRRFSDRRRKRRARGVAAPRHPPGGSGRLIEARLEGFAEFA